jgi:hypothetical protein
MVASCFHKEHLKSASNRKTTSQYLSLDRLHKLQAESQLIVTSYIRRPPYSIKVLPKVLLLLSCSSLQGFSKILSYEELISTATYCMYEFFLQKKTTNNQVAVLSTYQLLHAPHQSGCETISTLFKMDANLLAGMGGGAGGGGGGGGGAKKAVHVKVSFV